MLCNKLLDWVMANSDGIQGYHRVIKRATIDNIAYFHVIRDSMGLIKYVPLSFDDVVVDVNSKDSLFRDASRIAIKKYIPVEKAKLLYGIQNLSFDNPAVSYENIGNDNLRIFLGKMFSANKQYVLVYETYRKQWVKDNNNEVTCRIVKETLVGYDNLFREMLPPQIKDFPIIPVYAEDTDNPYKLGEVHFMKGTQKFINKAYGVALFNAQMMSNPKVMVRETDIPQMDIDTFEDNFSRPGSIGVLTGQASDPIIIQGQPLNSAFFTMYQDAVQQFNDATIPSQILGYMNSDNSQRQTSSLLDIKESVLDSFKDYASNIEKAVTQLGRVALQFIQAYLNEDTVIKITDGEEHIEVLRINYNQGLDLDDQQSIANYVQHLKQQGMNDAQIEAELQKASESKEYVEKINYVMNNINDLNYDVYVVPGSYTPTYKMALLRLMMELFGMQAVDNEAVLEQAPIPNKKEIIERNGHNALLRRRNEELEAELEAFKEALKGREKELADLGIKNILTEAKFKQQKILADSKLKAYLAKHRNKLITSELINKLHDDIRDMRFREQVAQAKRELLKMAQNEQPKQLTAEEIIDQLLPTNKIEE